MPRAKAKPRGFMFRAHTPERLKALECLEKYTDHRTTAAAIWEAVTWYPAARREAAHNLERARQAEETLARLRRSWAALVAGKNELAKLLDG